MLNILFKRVFSFEPNTFSFQSWTCKRILKHVSKFIVCNTNTKTKIHILRRNEPKYFLGGRKFAINFDCKQNVYLYNQNFAEIPANRFHQIISMYWRDAFFCVNLVADSIKSDTADITLKVWMVCFISYENLTMDHIVYYVENRFKTGPADVSDSASLRRDSRKR